jgi:PAS domain S-box-containing protein
MSTELPSGFFEHLVADCPDAVIYADAAGCIRYWNGAATLIFGYGEGEAVGARLDLIIPERLRSRHWEGYDKVMGGAESRYGAGAVLAVPALHKDGRQISTEFNGSPASQRCRDSSRHRRVPARHHRAIRGGSGAASGAGGAETSL